MYTASQYLDWQPVESPAAFPRFAHVLALIQGGGAAVGETPGARLATRDNPELFLAHGAVVGRGSICGNSGRKCKVVFLPKAVSGTISSCKMFGMILEWHHGRGTPVLLRVRVQEHWKRHSISAECTRAKREGLQDPITSCECRQFF